MPTITPSAMLVSAYIADNWLITQYATFAVSPTRAPHTGPPMQADRAVPNESAQSGSPRPVVISFPTKFRHIQIAVNAAIFHAFHFSICLSVLHTMYKVFTCQPGT